MDHRREVGSPPNVGGYQGAGERRASPRSVQACAASPDGGRAAAGPASSRAPIVQRMAEGGNYAPPLNEDTAAAGTISDHQGQLGRASLVLHHPVSSGGDGGIHPNSSSGGLQSVALQSELSASSATTLAFGGSSMTQPLTQPPTGMIRDEALSVTSRHQSVDEVDAGRRRPLCSLANDDSAAAAAADGHNCDGPAVIPVTALVATLAEAEGTSSENSSTSDTITQSAPAALGAAPHRTSESSCGATGSRSDSGAVPAASSSEGSVTEEPCVERLSTEKVCQDVAGISPLPPLGTRHDTPAAASVMATTLISKEDTSGIVGETQNSGQMDCSDRVTHLQAISLPPSVSDRGNETASDGDTIGSSGGHQENSSLLEQRNNGVSLPITDSGDDNAMERTAPQGQETDEKGVLVLGPGGEWHRWPHSRRVLIERRPEGFGFTLRNVVAYPSHIHKIATSLGKRPKDVEPWWVEGKPLDAVVVREVRECGAAQAAGLRPHDRIVAHRGVLIDSYAKFVAHIHQCSSVLELDVVSGLDDPLLRGGLLAAGTGATCSLLPGGLCRSAANCPIAPLGPSGTEGLARSGLCPAGSAVTLQRSHWLSSSLAPRPYHSPYSRSGNATTSTVTGLHSRSDQQQQPIQLAHNSPINQSTVSLTESVTTGGSVSGAESEMSLSLPSIPLTTSVPLPMPNSSSVVQTPPGPMPPSVSVPSRLAGGQGEPNWRQPQDQRGTTPMRREQTTKKKKKSKTKKDKRVSSGIAAGVYRDEGSRSSSLGSLGPPSPGIPVSVAAKLQLFEGGGQGFLARSMEKLKLYRHELTRMASPPPNTVQVRTAQFEKSGTATTGAIPCSNTDSYDYSHSNGSGGGGDDDMRASGDGPAAAASVSPPPDAVGTVGCVGNNGNRVPQHHGCSSSSGGGSSSKAGWHSSGTRNDKVTSGGGGDKKSGTTSPPPPGVSLKKLRTLFADKTSAGSGTSGCALKVLRCPDNCKRLDHNWRPAGIHLEKTTGGNVILKITTDKEPINAIMSRLLSDPASSNLQVSLASVEQSKRRKNVLHLTAGGSPLGTPPPSPTTTTTGVSSSTTTATVTTGTTTAPTSTLTTMRSAGIGESVHDSLSHERNSGLVTNALYEFLVQCDTPVTIHNICSVIKAANNADTGELQIGPSVIERAAAFDRRFFKNHQPTSCGNNPSASSCATKNLQQQQQPASTSRKAASASIVQRSKSRRASVGDEPTLVLSAARVRPGIAIGGGKAVQGMSIGVPLETCPPSAEDPLVPWIVAHCCSIIEARGLDVMGIYRIPGNSAAVQQLIAAVNNQLPVKMGACGGGGGGPGSGSGTTTASSAAAATGAMKLRDTRWSDVNVTDVSSLLKSFFRLLPEPLLTGTLYQHFIAVDKIPDSRHRLAALHALLHRLPPAHLGTLRFFCAHLRRVAARSEVNKMDSRNLSIVLGPTLVRSATGPCGAQSSMMSMISDMRHQCHLTEALVNYADYLFSDDPMSSSALSTLVDLDPLPSSSSSESLAVASSGGPASFGGSTSLATAVSSKLSLLPGTPTPTLSVKQKIQSFECGKPPVLEECVLTGGGGGLSTAPVAGTGAPILPAELHRLTSVAAATTTTTTTATTTTTTTTTSAPLVVDATAAGVPPSPSKMAAAAAIASFKRTIHFQPRQSQQRQASLREMQQPFLVAADEVDENALLAAAVVDLSSSASGTCGDPMSLSYHERRVLAAEKAKVFEAETRAVLEKKAFRSHGGALGAAGGVKEQKMNREQTERRWQEVKRQATLLTRDNSDENIDKENQSSQNVVDPSSCAAFSQLSSVCSSTPSAVNDATMFSSIGDILGGLSTVGDTHMGQDVRVRTELAADVTISESGVTSSDGKRTVEDRQVRAKCPPQTAAMRNDDDEVVTLRSRSGRSLSQQHQHPMANRVGNRNGVVYSPNASKILKSIVRLEERCSGRGGGGLQESCGAQRKKSRLERRHTIAGSHSQQHHHPEHSHHYHHHHPHHCYHHQQHNNPSCVALAGAGNSVSTGGFMTAGERALLVRTPSERKPRPSRHRATT